MSHYESIAEETKHHEMLAADELHAGEHVHVSPFWPMTIVFVVLLFLTVFTALTAHYIYLGHAGNLVLALIIASTKAALVFAYFMHLRYDKLINTVIVLSCLFGVLLFIGFVLIDAAGRNLPGSLDSQYIIRGGNKHVIRNPDGTVTFTAGAGIVQNAQQKAIAAHGNPASGEAHGSTPAADPHAAPTTPAHSPPATPAPAPAPGH